MNNVKTKDRVRISIKGIFEDKHTFKGKFFMTEEVAGKIVQLIGSYQRMIV